MYIINVVHHVSNARFQSLSGYYISMVQETARAREYAATSPLSRVTAAAFPLASEYDTASSPARDHTCVCVCFILCDRLPYTAYVESPALAWRLYQVPIVSQSCE